MNVNAIITKLLSATFSGFRWKKMIAIAAIVIAYSLLNYFLRLQLPGISYVDIRPLIVLIFAAGYFYGPVWGFLA